MCFRNGPKNPIVSSNLFTICIDCILQSFYIVCIEYYVNLLFSAANSNYEDFSVYDIADMIKLYFRELPEPVLTTKLSEMLIIIQQSEFNSIYFTLSFWSAVLLIGGGAYLGVTEGEGERECVCGKYLFVYLWIDFCCSNQTYTCGYHSRSHNYACTLSLSLSLSLSLLRAHAHYRCS